MRNYKFDNYSAARRWSYIIENVFFLTLRILVHSAPEYFEKLPLKKTKNPTLNGYVSKTRADAQPKLKFSETSFKFLQTSALF